MATYTLTLPSYTPTSTNALMRSVRARIRLKKSDREIICHYAREQGLPLAMCKRRVSVAITLGKGQRQMDPDNVLKSLLDALVCAGLLVDDGPRWVQLGEVTWHRGERKTVITLEDIYEV